MGKDALKMPQSAGHSAPQCNLCSRTPRFHRCSCWVKWLTRALLCNDWCRWSRQCRFPLWVRRCSPSTRSSTSLLYRRCCDRTVTGSCCSSRQTSSLTESEEGFSPFHGIFRTPSTRSSSPTGCPRRPTVVGCRGLEARCSVTLIRCIVVAVWKNTSP